ncbi:MAG: AAA family ATPase [Fusicatenibacter sp.]
MEKVEFDLDFRKLKENENLYDNENLDRYYTVTAQYLKRPGYEHDPDVCAIPRTPSDADVMALGCVRINSYDPEALESMRKYEKLEEIRQLDHVMAPLGLHLDVSLTMNALLLESYKIRSLVRSDVYQDGPAEKQGFAYNLLSIKDNFTPRPTGFFLYGKTGCGKTMSVHLASRLYPKSIRHQFEDISYIQIPVIYVTAMMKQMSAVFRSIATQIDEILGTGDLHQSKVMNNSMTKAKSFLKTWIKKYHIGMIIIDEVQFLNISGKGINLEDIIGIMEETGCHFGLIGNEDAKTEIFKAPRIVSRIEGNIINADQRTTNSIKLFERALETLWNYQWTPEYTELTDEIKDLLIHETTMNISLLKYMLIKVQTEAVVADKQDEITTDYITKKTEKDVAKLRDLIADPEDRKEIGFMNYMSELYTRVAEISSDEKEGEKGRLLEAMDRGKITKQQALVKNAAFKSITNTTDFSEAQINRAIAKAIEKEASLLDKPEKYLSMAALEILNKMKRDVKSKQTRKANKVVNAREKDEATKKALDMLFDKAN